MEYNTGSCRVVYGKWLPSVGSMATALFAARGGAL
jgi:hypothetical protein